ncbi:otolith matrix protein OMM-64 isoform X2 [Oryzias melastigma]|uniref:otolith matrix protein OMM-64 isoform X2 n=1 Tax=Oryzias melastigma TaxID=30732 RepID=UPI00168D060A|nr:otolith matrix protein OMM-64 isoform X2 [Oryzias melastigma]
MENFADLLTDAFSETSVPSFHDEDLDFESLGFDDQRWREKAEDTTTYEDLLQEAAAASGALLEEDVLFVAERADEEQDSDESPEVNFEDETPEKDYKSSDEDSDQEGSVSGEDEEVGSGTAEEPGELLMEAHCLGGDKEDKIFTEGRPLDPEGGDNPQVRNKTPSEVEGDVDVGYFGGVPERSREMMMMIAMKEEEQERESENLKEKQEESVPSDGREDPCSDGKTSEMFPDISLEYLQDLIDEVDDEEECVEKIAEFSGEEHQEAGESFADYPSDFSSCEYTEGGGNDHEQKMSAEPSARQDVNVEESAAEMKTTAELFDEEEKDEVLYSIDLEMSAMLIQDEGQPQLLLGASGGDDGDETGKSGSSSSSDDDEKLIPEESEENMSSHDAINTELTGNIQLYGDGIAMLSRWGASDDHHFTDNTDEFTSFELLKTDNETLLSTPPSDVNRSPDDDPSTTSQNEERKKATLSNQGSIDDDFLFENEQSSTWNDEQGELGDDEDEKDRWEQEHERIEAFYKFYNDSDEDNAGERQTKVQFCSNPLSQVIHYDNESDRDSDTSSSNRDEDLNSAERSEELVETEDMLQIKPASDPPTDQPPESPADVSNTPACTEHHESPQLLKLVLKMSVMMVMGLLMFCLTTDQADWFSQFFFF